MSLGKWGWGLVLFLTLFGCDRGVRNVGPAIESAQASDNSGKTLLVMDRKHLSDKLVWSTWIERIDGTVYPDLMSGFNSEAQLVHFQLSDDQKFVHLFQENENPDDIRGPNLIDRFPVVSLTSQSVTFDFAQGLGHRQFRNWLDPKKSAEFQMAYSAVSNFENSAGVVTFAQLIKMIDASESTAILHHDFRLSDDGSGFVPVRIPSPLKVGIMPASFANTENGDQPVTIRRWDIRHPITMYISNNTPLEFVPAIKEGLEWWNNALGTEFIKVEVLDHPVRWGDARLNILQWSDDPTVCKSASAIGPSEANPLTGQIYSGKILFCGRTLLPTYEAAIPEGGISREAYFAKLMAWTAAHEMGHVLGWTHNFKGKLYRDPSHPEVLNSTVMDYPYPTEIPNYTSVGAADVAKVNVSYLKAGSSDALEALKQFPFCSDDDTATQPDCERFVRGGLTPVQLMDRYIAMIDKGEKILPLEHKVRLVAMKQLLSVGDAHAVASVAHLLKVYPGSMDLFVSELKTVTEASHLGFALLPFENQKAVLTVFVEGVLNTNARLSMTARTDLIEAISATQNIAGFSALRDLNEVLKSSIETQTDASKATEFYLLQDKVKASLENFWH